MRIKKSFCFAFIVSVLGLTTVLSFKKNEATSNDQFVSSEVPSETSPQNNAPPTEDSLAQQELQSLVQLYAETAGNPQAHVSTPPSDLSETQYISLSRMVTNPTLDGKIRRASLFVLTHAPSQHWPLLAKLVKEPLPSFPNLAKHQSLDSLAYNFEVSLRITALETLDQWAQQQPSILKGLLQITEKQLDPKLLFFAQISISGIQEGQPGKLGRFINQLLAKAL